MGNTKSRTQSVHPPALLRTCLAMYPVFVLRVNTCPSTQDIKLTLFWRNQSVVPMRLNYCFVTHRKRNFHTCHPNIVFSRSVKESISMHLLIEILFLFTQLLLYMSNKVEFNVSRFNVEFQKNSAWSIGSTLFFKLLVKYLKPDFHFNISLLWNCWKWLVNILCSVAWKLSVT